MNKKKLFIIIALMLFATGLFAATGSITSNVKRVLINQNSSWGGCMVLIDNNNGSCPAGWYHFDCSNSVGSGSWYSGMAYSTAMAALLSGKKIVVYWDDSKKMNGYCYAYRVDLLNY